MAQQTEQRICPTCDAGDPTSVITFEDCECPKAEQRTEVGIHELMDATVIGYKGNMAHAVSIQLRLKDGTVVSIDGGKPKVASPR